MKDSMDDVKLVKNALDECEGSIWALFPFPALFGH